MSIAEHNAVFAGPSGPAAKSDEDLARCAQAGSLACFGELVDRYEGRLRSFLARRCGDATAAEDLAQESFVRAWRSIGRYDPERRFSTWLFTIGARLATDHLRRHAREKETNRRAVAEPRREGAVGPVEAARAGGEVWRVAERVLNEESMSALWLRYVGEMEIPDIARVLGRTRGTTRVILFRARERVARALGAAAERTRGLPLEVRGAEAPAERGCIGAVS